ncbi:MAG: glycosyltransferase family 2 protein [Phycisphaeraceae bacterium]
MTNTRVSCIIPAHNAARYLEETVASVLAQTRPVDEIVVVDDGSTDDTARLAESFGAPVRCERLASERGPAGTRNFGVQCTSGEFVAFLDQDDLWMPEKTERQLEAFDAHPALDLCLTHVQRLWSDALRDRRLRLAHVPRANRAPGYATISLLARRSVFEDVGLLDEALWFSDAPDWLLRARRAGKTLHVLDDVLVWHRMHESNLTERANRASREEFVDLVKRNLDYARRAEQAQTGAAPCE